ncbi:hypothetical protein N7481_003243 [Penicillium waksmanii]|uniref:uncharacterized protein n=1 Tax=Penicillium waksmanii TaxID=69791 RepID=UPI0025481048|nr:uncharacterized protein N7481_003243 [Penicillium waksmanii]KAJ5988033.1 hypothetical protein N7481_003243 [Penicillium waksmanii]
MTRAIFIRVLFTFIPLLIFFPDLLSEIPFVLNQHWMHMRQQHAAFHDPKSVILGFPYQVVLWFIPGLTVAGEVGKFFIWVATTVQKWYRERRVKDNVTAGVEDPVMLSE